MKTYYVKLNEIYTITSTADCEVYNASGTLIATCPANRSINVSAATNKLTLSDDNAAIKKAVEDVGVTPQECVAHIDNTGIHTTVAEKQNCSNHIANKTIHVTSAQKSKLETAASTSGGNLFYGSQVFDGGITVNQTSWFYAEIHKTSQESTLSDDSVLNRAEMDARYLSAFGGSFAGDVTFGAGSMLDITSDCKGVTIGCTTQLYRDTTKPTSSLLNGYSVLNKQEADRLYGLVGKIEHYAGSSVPDGYLLCDGSAVSRSQYKALFTAIGTTWGVGDGSTTFNLPNLIDRVIWGASTAGGYLEAGLPNIEGTFNACDSNSNFIRIYGTGVFSNMTTTSSNLSGSSSGTKDIVSTVGFNASRSSSIYGNSSTVQPPAVKLIPIIKY